MTTQPTSHQTSPRGLQRIIEAERAGAPFLHWHDAQGDLQIKALDGGSRLSIGRRASNDVVLDGDGEISRAHAELERLGADWAVSDEGFSRNGTFVNGLRIDGRKRLADRDLLRFGKVILTYRNPAAGETTMTTTDSHLPRVESLTDMQRRVLVALSRPYKTGEVFAAPATNKQIAAEVGLSVERVKGHLNIMFGRFQIAEEPLKGLPQNHKRVRLVECALKWGLVSRSEL